MIRKETRVIGDEWCEIKIEIKGDEAKPVLSITGRAGSVKHQRGGERYTASNGVTYDLESSGQITETIAKFFPEYAPLLPWRLNDMRAGCEHQRATWNTTAEVEIVTYKLTSAALAENAAIRRYIDEALRETGTVTLSDEYRGVLALPYSTTQAPSSEGWGSGRYEVTKRETKHVGWVKPSEHPMGLLGKPCEVCGYKYGTGWLHEVLPADILKLARGES